MKPVLPLLALGLGLAGAAQADEPVFSVSGYGTLAWTQMSGDNAQYRVGTAEPNGAGHAGSLELGDGGAQYSLARLQSTQFARRRFDLWRHRLLLPCPSMIRVSLRRSRD